jgi:hypothetical protein
MTAPARHSPVAVFLGIVLCMVAFRSASGQVPEAVEGPLKIQAAAPQTHAVAVDNDALIRMFKAGLGDDLLIQTIQLQPGHYDTSPDALIALKQAGISDRVISTLQAHGTGLAVRANTAAAAEARQSPPAPPPAGVDGIGLYFKDAQGQWQPMETEIVHIKSGGFVKSTLTHGIIKEDRNGVVTGREAKLLLPRPIEFLIYTPDGVDAAEYEVLRFRLNSKDREFRTLTGGVIHSTGGAQRDDVPIKPVKIATHTYTFSLAKDTPGGEYGILPPGTGNITNGGKIYTFAISE